MLQGTAWDEFWAAKKPQRNAGPLAGIGGGVDGGRVGIQVGRSELSSSHEKRQPLVPARSPSKRVALASPGSPTMGKRTGPEIQKKGRWDGGQEEPELTVAFPPAT